MPDLTTDELLAAAEGGYLLSEIRARLERLEKCEAALKEIRDECLWPAAARIDRAALEGR